MLSIYQKDIVEKICKEYCDGVEENGKTIKTGMIFWVKKRVDKFCISRNIEVKKLKSELSIIKIKEILEAKYFEQIDVKNDEQNYQIAMQCFIRNSTFDPPVKNQLRN